MTDLTEVEIRLLRKVGRTLHGPRWQTELGRQFGHRDGRRVRQWLAGERPIPPQFWEWAVARLQDLEHKARELALVARITKVRL